MTERDFRSQTYVDWVLVLLEERFPWLGKESDEEVSGTDTVDELTDLHRSLTDQRTADYVKSELAPEKKHQTPRPIENR
jgi:hypothetical protein